MALFKTHDGCLLNTQYVVMVSPIRYNETMDYYYYVITMYGQDFSLTFHFDRRMDAEKELYLLMQHMQ